MGFLVKAVKSVVKAIVSVVKTVAGGLFGILVGGKKTTAKAKSTNTLNKSLDPEAFRKIVLGKTASPLDVRYWEVYGANAASYDEVIALACHQVNGVKELYFESDLGFDQNGTVQTKFSGVVSRAVNLGTPNQTALSVGGGTQWTANATFDGCAHMVLKWVPDEKKLPNGIPSRYTQVVEGALVYDPRRDSTVAGGSGTHRINDQTTWSYATLDGNGQPIGRNNALQVLWYLLGWRVATKDSGGTVTGSALVCGRGIDPQDINLSSFIAAANACETAGYYTDLTLSTEDNHTSNEDKITCNGLIGTLIDPGGLWSYYPNIDDTANIAVDITDADVLQGRTVTWNEYKPMSDQYNQVSGKFMNGSAITLYQMFPYPLVRDATYETNLGVKRRKPQDFEQVLDNVLAQRLARLLLNQGQYQGEFQADFNYKLLKAQAWSVVRYTSERFGWTKLFRVWRYDLSTSDGVGLLLREIHPSIWSAGSVASAVSVGTGTKYDPNQQISLTGLSAVQQTITGPGASPTKYDGALVSWDAPPINVRRTQVRYRVTGTSYWETLPDIERGTATSALAYPMVSGANYDVQARHISIHEIEGPWVSIAPYFTAGTQGNVNYAGIAQAAQTATWTGVTSKPVEVTDGRIAAGLNSTGDVNRRVPSDKVDINTSNLVKDYNYQDTSLWFTLNGAGFDTSSTASLNALGVSKAIRYAAGTTNGQLQSPKYPVSSTASYIASSRVLLKAGFYGTLQIAVTFYDKSGNFISQSTKTIQYTSGSPITANTIIEVASPSIVSPANAVTAGINYFGSASGGDIFAAYSAIREVSTPAVVQIGDTTNLLDDADFANAEVTWQASAPGLTKLANSTAGEGAGAYKLRFDTSKAITIRSTLVQCGPNVSIIPSVYRKKVSGTTGAIYAAIMAFDATGAFIGYVTNSFFLLDSPPGTGFTTPVTVKTPANTAAIAMVIYTSSGAYDAFVDVATPTIRFAAVAGVSITKNDGTTVMADVDIYTPLGTAADFVGRGALARQNTADWATQVGSRPTELTDGRIAAGLTNTGDLNRDISTSRANSSALLRYTGGGLFTGELAADVTGTHTAADFPGRGALARKNQADYDADIVEGTVYKRVGASDVGASGQLKLTIAGSGRLLGDQRNIPSVTTLNLRSRFSGQTVTYTAAAGSPATATISVSAFSAKMGSATVSYGASSVGVSGTNGSTVTYYLYWDDATYAGGSKTLVASTNIDDVFSADGRVFVGSVAVIFPTSGSGGGSGGGGGGSCVDVESWLSTLFGFVLAGEAQPGEEIECATVDMSDRITQFIAMTKMPTTAQPSYRMVTSSGASVVASATTPMTLRDLTIVDFADMLGREALVKRADTLAWEVVEQLEFVGLRHVAFIGVNDGVYFAGESKKALIATHNIIQKDLN